MATQGTDYRAYKFDVNGVTHYSVEPWVGNVPWSFTPITQEEFKAGMESQLASDPSRWKPFYDQQKQNIANYFAGAQSPYTMVNGVPVLRSQLDEQAANEAAVAAGTMIKVPIGSGFGYIPSGTASATNYEQNIASGATAKTQQIQQSIAGANDRIKVLQSFLSNPTGTQLDPNMSTSARRLQELLAAKADPANANQPNYGIGGYDIDIQIARARANVQEELNSLQKEISTLQNQIPGGATGPLSAGTTTSGTQNTNQTSQPQYQILNVEAMQKYSPDQYERIGGPGGPVVLKPGVQPIEGTVKVIGGTTPPPGGTPPPSGGGTPPPGGSPPPGDGAGGESTGNPQLDALLATLQSYLETLIAQGQRINPNIELDPATVQQFLDQATAEIDPYYQNLFNVVAEDVSRNLEELQRDYQLQREGLQEQFRSTLDTRREDRAGAGTFFSGARGAEEQRIAAASSRDIQSAANRAASTAGSILRSAEENIGTNRVLSIGVPNIQTYTPNTSTSTFAPGRTLDVFSGVGTPGSLEYKRRADVRQLSDYLKSQEVARRSLNF